MIVLAKMVALACSIAVIGFLAMAGLRLYQGLTGQYGRNEAIDDPFGSAIVYVMMATVFWVLGLFFKFVLEKD